MKRFLIFACIVGFFETSFCQEFWEPYGRPGDGLICFSLASAGHFYYCGTNSGFYRYSDFDGDWQYMGFQNYVLLDISNAGNQVFAIVGQQSLYHSNNYGTTWSLVNLPVVYDFVIADDLILVGVANNDKILRSSDYGVSWEPSGAGLPGGSQISGLGFVGDGQFLAGLWSSQNTGHLYRSTDGGLSWVPTNIEGLPGIAEFHFAKTGTHSYVGTRHNEGHVGTIYRSSGGTRKWIEFNEGLPPNFGVTSLIVNPAGEVIASSARNHFGGVYFYADKNEQWTEIESGLSDKKVYSVTLTKDQYLLAATESGGVFRSYRPIRSLTDSDFVMGIETVPKPGKISAIGNYPNPFNPSTVIRYQLGSNDWVTVTVFDLMGQRIATLHDSFQFAGRHELVWKGTTEGGTPVASGLYIYRIVANNDSAVGKMLLVR